MESTQTPDDFLEFTAEQVDGLKADARQAIQSALAQSPRDVCTWVQDNLDHWIELARDKLHRYITVENAHQSACDIVQYLCRHYHLPVPHG